MLIVEDCPEVLEAMTSLLRVHGCTVVTAASGRDAFVAFEQGLRPCMMLLDLRMPDMDGWEVWDRMRTHNELHATPVVILSGEIPDSARARAVGIQPPLSPGDPDKRRSVTSRAGTA